jgi:hypothetical protein
LLLVVRVVVLILQAAAVRVVIEHLLAQAEVVVLLNPP